MQKILGALFVGERFIENINFPFSKVSSVSATEKGPGRPPHWEMAFWWTRKPLISARAVIAGAILPSNTSPVEFLWKIGISEELSSKKKAKLSVLPHRVAPHYRFHGTKLLDPFAGFGSIPLEGLRLGLEVTAVELLPTAYAFLKAVLEYPAKYGQRLVEDLRKWSEWITQRLREDPLIRELYEDDVIAYIGTWEVKCPRCGRWTPLVSNWWLTRAKGSKGYERLAWMAPVVKGDEVAIEVIDLNKLYGDEAVKKARVSRSEVRLGAVNKELRVPDLNVNARRGAAECLLCHRPITFVSPEVNYVDETEFPRDVEERAEAYIKYALGTYNRSLEGENVEALARQRLLVKVKVRNGDLEFEPCTEEDQEKLELAREEIERMLQEGDPDIPRELIPPYGHKGGGLRFPTKIIRFWFELFNPRQLLTLVKLVELIREAGKKIEEEKRREGLDEGEAFKYAEAVTVYLAIALLKYASYNSISTSWDPVFQKTTNTLAFRGIGMTWNWVDLSPFAKSTGSWIRSLDAVEKGLKYLVNAVNRAELRAYAAKSRSGGSAKVVLDDATLLTKLGDEKFDLIVTDPPYYDDVAYAELSDFYYVWLKRALSDVDGERLMPRFLRKAFFEEVSGEWAEIRTQWERFALSEVSLNPSRLGTHSDEDKGTEYYQGLLNAAFKSMTSRVNDNGLIITYYAHNSPKAWISLLKAGWKEAGLRVTGLFPVETELKESVVKRGKLSMDTSLVVLWRKGAEGSIRAPELYELMAKAAEERARKLLRELHLRGRDLFIGTLVAALSVATKYKEVVNMAEVSVEELVEKYVYPSTCDGIINALSGITNVNGNIKSPDAMLYILVKFLVPGAEEKVVDSTDLRIFSIGIGSTPISKDAIGKLRLLKPKSTSGAEVAKAKAYALIEPTSTDREDILSTLAQRGINPSNPQVRCVVDALHLLEYYAIAYTVGDFKKLLEELKGKYAEYVQEAESMARILAKVLDSRDPEKALCERVVRYIEMGKGIKTR